MIITMSKKKNLLELAGGVVALVTLAALLTIAFTPKAHAISEAYRKQLQHSHTTQAEQAGEYQQAVPAAKHFKAVHAKKYGVDFKRGTDGIGYADGKPCATDEVNAEAAAYACGVHQIIVRAAGRVELMKDGQYVGRMN